MSGRRKTTKRGGDRAGWGILGTMLQTGLFIGTAVLLICIFLSQLPAFATADALFRRLVSAQPHAAFLIALCLGITLAWVEYVNLIFWRIPNPMHKLLSSGHTGGSSSSKGALAKRNAMISALEGQLRTAKTQSDDTIKGLESKLKAVQETLELTDHVLAACSRRQTVVDYLVRAVGTEDFDGWYKMYVDALACQAGRLPRKQARNSRTTIMEYDTQSGRLLRVSQVPNGRVRFEPHKGHGVAGHVVTTGEPAIIGDVLQDPRYIPVEPCVGGSLLVVPVDFGKEVVGVINVSHAGNDAFDKDDVHRMESLADWLAIGIALKPISRELVELRGFSGISRED
jgi:hypothetical protein